MRSAAAFAAFTVLVACGRDPRLGDPCSKGDAYCIDMRWGLVCMDGALMKIECGGAGCEKFGSKAVCQPARVDGNPCFGDEPTVCENSRKISCDVKRFATVVECKGRKGCTGADGQTCDQSSAAQEDRCENERAVACSLDSTSLLTCEAGRFIVEARCNGPKRCVVSPEGKPVCDDPQPVSGAPCTDGTAVCSWDKKGVMICKNRKYELVRQCRGSEGCYVKDGALACDTSVADENDVCDLPPDFLTCSADKKTIMSCQKGKIVKDKPCGFKKCTPVGPTVACR